MIRKRIPLLVKLSDANHYIIAGSDKELYRLSGVSGPYEGLGFLVYYNQNKFGPLIKYVTQANNGKPGLLLFQNDDLYVVVNSETGVDFTLIAGDIKSMGQPAVYSPFFLYGLLYYTERQIIRFYQRFKFELF